MSSLQGKHAKCRQYVGHSAHVTNVRFSNGDQQLVSTGGADTAVVVWQYRGGQGADQEVTSSPSTTYISEESDTDSEEEGIYVGAGQGRKGQG